MTHIPKKMFQTMNPSGGTSSDSGTDITKAQSLNNHGVLYAEMKQLDDAEKCFNQALALYKLQSTQSIGMAHVLYNLGCLYSDFLNDKRKKSCLEEALDIYTTISPDHPNIKTIQRMLGGTSGLSDTEAAISSNQALQSLSPAQDTITSKQPEGAHCDTATTDTSTAGTPTAEATTTCTAAAFAADNGRMKPKRKDKKTLFNQLIAYYYAVWIEFLSSIIHMTSISDFCYQYCSFILYLIDFRSIIRICVLFV